MRWFIIFLVLIPSWASAETKQEIIERYRLRYQDFFGRIKAEESRDQKRLAGRREVREERQERAELLNRARKQFILSKPPPADMTKAYQIHLAEEAAAKKRHLKTEERYSRTQREAEKAKQGAIQIPPVLEFGLENQL